MAHRDPNASVTAVDNPAALQAARRTAESIGILDRFETEESIPWTAAELAPRQFDLVLLAQRLHCLDTDDGNDLLKRSTSAAKPGGRVVVIDLFRGPGRPNLAECVEALRLELATESGRMRTLEETQQRLAEAGLREIQFTFLPASQINMGMAVGVVPA